VVAAEVFPQRLRGKGMTLTTLANWLTNFMIARTLPNMLLPDNFDLWGTFTFFAAFCAFMTVFILVCLPESNGVDLEKMDMVFHDFTGQPLYKRVRLSTKGALDDDEDVVEAGALAKGKDIELAFTGDEAKEHPTM